MKTIKLKINPLSSFATFPKGDMIFGYFTYYLFLNKDKRLQNYLKEDPKIIFSDFLPNGYLPKPALPLDSFGVDSDNKKDFRKKEWIKIENLQSGNLKECEDFKFYERDLRVRNKINRKFFSTTEENFAPFGIEEIAFKKEPVLYVMFDDKSFDKEGIAKILNEIGKNGFGKKSSVGKGQFEVELDENFKGFDKTFDTKYYLTISPTILKSKEIKNCYYNLFNRFGKYSYSSKPFKKPVLMADSGAVIELDERLDYIGKAANNGINNENPSFLQGYSILVPFKFDEKGLKDG